MTDRELLDAIENAEAVKARTIANALVTYAADMAAGDSKTEAERLRDGYDEYATELEAA